MGNPVNSAKPCCMAPGCKGKPRSRGLCENCYTKAKRLVALGTVTWEQLVAAGRCLPAVDRITRWLLEAAKFQPKPNPSRK